MRRRIANSNVSSALIYGVIILVFFAFIVVCQYGCGQLADEKTAIGLLRESGFSHIQITNRDPWFPEIQGCGKEDVVDFTATAINPAGQRVTVNVCQGWPFKGATLRGQ